MLPEDVPLMHLILAFPPFLSHSLQSVHPGLTSPKPPTSKFFFQVVSGDPKLRQVNCDITLIPNS